MKAEVTIASHYGLWQYNQSRDTLEACIWLEQLLEGKAAYTYMKIDSLQNIWYVADGVLKVLHYDADKQEYRRVTNEQFLKGALIGSGRNRGRLFTDYSGQPAGATNAVDIANQEGLSDGIA